MGSSTIIDIIGAVIIGGLLMLNAIRLYTNSQENAWEYSSESIVQQNLIDITTLLERDFIRIGYQRGAENIPHAIHAITEAEDNHIEFLADMDNNGTMETVEFLVGDADDLTGTVNPNDMPFFRRINGVGDAVTTYGVTEFFLEYYNYTGDRIPTPVANKGEIATITITVVCQNPSFSDQDYERYNPRAFYRQMRLAIPNLRYK